MEWLRNAPGRFKKWVAGSIRRKLTLFVLLVCLMLIVLFWLFGVQLLEPVYNTTIRADLVKTMDTVTGVINKAYKDGRPIVETYTSEDGGTLSSLSVECIDRLNEKITDGDLNISSLCVDMADDTLTNVMLEDNLPSECVLHKNRGLIDRSTGVALESTYNNETVIAMRALVFQSSGDLYRQTSSQMILGRTAADGTLSVLISTNLERIPQAVSVLSKLMFSVSILLIVLSVFCAFIFSHWFTKPITRLSKATQELAKGNYDVRVKDNGGDEIAKLSQDFNVMATEVKRSVDLQKDILANVSHDLRTPLTLIKGYAETVRDLTGDDPDKRTQQLNVIVDESDRLSDLVGSVMELSRMSSGNEKANPILFDMAELCEEVAFRYETLSNKSGHHFVFTSDENCEVVADPGLVERALHNLLGNALNHVGEDGYIGFTIKKTPQNTVRVEVADHGPGISEQDQAHLFDRYYRSRADAGKPGTGLGLSITKVIFEMSGFTYGIDSTLGEGATFWFEAPLALRGGLPD